MRLVYESSVRCQEPAVEDKSTSCISLCFGKPVLWSVISNLIYHWINCGIFDLQKLLRKGKKELEFHSAKIDFTCDVRYLVKYGLVTCDLIHNEMELPKLSSTSITRKQKQNSCTGCLIRKISFSNWWGCLCIFYFILFMKG